MDDKGDSGPVRGQGTGFKRHIALAGVVLTAAEILFVVLPLASLFHQEIDDGATLLRIALPVLIGAEVLWFAATAYWWSPIFRAVNTKKRDERFSEEIAGAAYRATGRLPLRLFSLRCGLWLGAGLATGGFLSRFSGWAPSQIIELGASACMLGMAANVARAIWSARFAHSLRAHLFAGLSPLRHFADHYFREMLLIGMTIFVGAAGTVNAFLYYSRAVTATDFIELQVAFLPAVALGLLSWGLYGWHSAGAINSYVQAEVSGGKAPGNTTEVYRRSQAMPYRMAAATVVVWTVIAVVETWLARTRFRFEDDDSVIMFGIFLVMAIGAALYSALWLRDTFRPLLEHLTLKHRLPIRGIRTALSLRTKLLVSFGGLVLFACGLALFWGFIQYKGLVTTAVSKQADLGLAWLRSEVQGAAAAQPDEPDAEFVRHVLKRVNLRSPEANAVFYYLADEPGAEVIALGGGPMGAPEIPWYARARMAMSADGSIAVSSQSLSGRHGRLKVEWGGRTFDLGSLAVFYPNYRGRGPSIVRPLKEMLVFFFVLFAACGGIVLFTVMQVVTPIRRLEGRADGMARGELAQPVSSGGEGDEVGRLTFALEEMRRALREKLRSTEEVNIDLERAVQRRTADLAKKNRELAETLEKLTRAQDQLVRAEKMASIGQLVAGIAHEINNPVNAIVNTVGPLGEAIADANSDDPVAKAEATNDIREMIRVVQRGARRTKDIVQALHNYSRTDDESVVFVDINRSIDDSLELLRHLLKQAIKVERNYGDVGRIRGHAGQLNQVLMNLLTNAAQAVGGVDGATITIETASVDGGVEIKISDNGGGIPDEILPRIFDPFFTTKDVGEGSGLGLSIVHGIVERHAGRIEVDSRAGQGTTFVLFLPRNDEPPAGDSSERV